MFNTREFVLRKLAAAGPRYLPFADVASEDVPLSRLLRLSLFQITVGMAIVLLVGTLNRVMIVELDVPATLVAGMVALPLVFAPLRTLIGYRSDTHVSALGLRRAPYIWKGTLYQFGGFAIMPFALLVLSGYGEAVDARAGSDCRPQPSPFCWWGPGFTWSRPWDWRWQRIWSKRRINPRSLG